MAKNKVVIKKARKPAKKTAKKKLPVGRPSKYSDALALRICELIATSRMGIHKLCEQHKDLPAVSTIFLWISAEQYFSERYARAKEIQADLLAGDIIEISDKELRTKEQASGSNMNGSFDTETIKDNYNRSRLQIDARKWLASKLAPKKYGDKVDVTTGGEKINSVVVTVVDNESAKAVDAIRKIKK
jgi:hypothetical protein